MDEMLTCPYCGAERTSENDVKCPECRRTYPDKEERIAGIPVKDMTAFVDKNAEFYIPVFKKNGTKKHFKSWNWAAAFFPVYWLFYRKMYSQGALYIVAVNTVSLLLSIIMAFCFSSTYIEKAQAKEDFDIWSGKVTEYMRNDPQHANYDNPEYAVISNKMWDANNRYEEAATTISIINLAETLITYAAVFVLMGLYGNSIYYNHVRKNVSRPNDGGTSFPGMIGALIISNLVAALVGVLLNFIITVLIIV